MIVGVTGCGGSAQGPVAVRVGDVSIGAKSVSHWAKTFRLGGEVASSLGESNGSPRERALHFLISASWLIGEAADRGLAVSDATVKHGLQERIGSVPNGKSEFEAEISATGRTVADVELEIKAETAATRLRALVSRRAGPVTRADVADYYRRHRSRFRVPEVRLTDLIESIHGTRDAAIALGKRIGPGRSFAKRALHERVARSAPTQAARRDNTELLRTIFAAEPDRIAEPARFNDAWVLVVVRKIVPGRIKSLAEVKEEIASRLTSQRSHVTMLDFLAAYRSKWTARTDCRPGFVVQKCSQYRGAKAPEGNPLSGG
jgi:foldase protein PrsA